MPTPGRRWCRAFVVAAQAVALATFVLNVPHVWRSSSPVAHEMRRWPTWPYVVAATFFGAEFLFSALISCSVLPILVHREGFTGNPELMHRMREVSYIMTFVSIVCAGCYLHLAMEDATPLLVSQSNWLTGDEEVRLMGRYMLWAILAPLQWVSFARLYTTASWREILSVCFTTSLVMLLGLLSATTRSISHGQVIWESQGRIFFLAAAMCFFFMFWQVFSLPIDPAAMASARKYLRFALVLWAAYPAAHASRSLGLLSLWQEQIFAYTLLDVIAKGVSLWICFSGPAFRMFLSSLGNHQIQSAMVDWKITVGDPDWDIKTPSTDGLAAMQMHWLGGNAVGSNFLQNVLDDNESRESLLSTARRVDSSPSFTTQKVTAFLRLKSERVPALLFVSRAVWGNRQLACALLQGVEAPAQGAGALQDSPAVASTVASTSGQLLKGLEEGSFSVARETLEQADDASERGSVRTARTGLSSIGGTIPLFRVDGTMTDQQR